MDWPLEVFKRCMTYGFWIASGEALFGFCHALASRWLAYRQIKNVIPTRFQRQRRRSVFRPGRPKEPILSLGRTGGLGHVESGRAVTEYGVQISNGFWHRFYHPETGEKYTLEWVETYVKLQAI